MTYESNRSEGKLIYFLKSRFN